MLVEVDVHKLRDIACRLTLVADVTKRIVEDIHGVINYVEMAERKSK